MAGAPLYLLVLTVSVYAAFLIGYGDEVFTAPGGCSGLIDCATDIFSGFFQFMTLGGFDSQLPGLIQVGILIFLVGGWGIVIADVLLP